MRKFHLALRSRPVGVCGLLATVLACVAAGPAMAAPVSAGSYSEAGLSWGDTSTCQAPAVSQPFLSWGHDQSWYALAPGQDAGGFTGAGWTLANGASVKSGVLQNGSTGSVLDMPSGSVAISPPMCVSSDYPTGRTLIRNVVGGDGVQVYVAYAGTHTAQQPQGVGQVHSDHNQWEASGRFDIHPGNLPGWQLVRFTLVAGGNASDFEVDDFYVDPRMMR